MASQSRLLLFAPGAGAPSSSTWMRAWSERLERFGRVCLFDYPYQRAGKKAPDRPDVLVATHRAEFDRCRAEHSGPIVLIGKSMGGRIGCHVAAQMASSSYAPSSSHAASGGLDRPTALVCLGYPLVAPRGAVRDQVLLDIETPILFVQGTRDSLCPLDRLAAVRERMRAWNELCVVEGGDHSLSVAPGLLRKQGLSPSNVDERVLQAIEGFVERWAY